MQEIDRNRNESHSKGADADGHRINVRINELFDVMEQKAPFVAAAGPFPENVFPNRKRTVFPQKREKRNEDNSQRVQGAKPEEIEKTALDEKGENRPEKPGEHKKDPEKVNDGYQRDQRLSGHFSKHTVFEGTEKAGLEPAAFPKQLQKGLFGTVKKRYFGKLET